MTPEYFARVSPTYIENWGNGLYDLSIRQIDIPLSLQEANIFGRQIGKYRTWFKPDKGSAVLMGRIIGQVKKAVDFFPKGAFVRLGSRSAKDSHFARNCGLRMTRSEDAIATLTADSRRIAFDLRMAIQNDYQPHIFIREWIDIPAWAEFRCFMKNRQLVGISQYDCKNLRHCLEVLVKAEKIKLSIQEFFEEFVRVVHLDDVVFDAFVVEDGQNLKVRFTY
jgi:hypothetical protein